MAMREVCKGSLLQQKLRPTSKPLKQKKTECMPEQWFVFCVHDDRVPLLEIYANDKEVAAHRPTKVIDLFHCLFICKSIDDDHSFVIGFKSESGRNVLEFAAITETLRDEWVSILSCKLQRTGHLEVNSNIYSPLPVLEVATETCPLNLPRLSSPRATLVDISPSDDGNSITSATIEALTNTGPLTQTNVSSSENFYEVPRGSVNNPVADSSFLGGGIQGTSQIYEHIAFGLRLSEASEELQHETVAEDHRDIQEHNFCSPRPTYSTISPRSLRKSETRGSKAPPVPPRKRSTSETLSQTGTTDTSLCSNPSTGMYDVLAPASLTPSVSPRNYSKPTPSAFQFPLPDYDSLSHESRAGSSLDAASPRLLSNGTVSAKAAGAPQKTLRSLDTVVPPPLPIAEETYQYQRYADPVNAPVTLEDIQRGERTSTKQRKTSTSTPRSSRSALSDLHSSEGNPSVPRTPVPAPPLPPRNSRGSSFRGLDVGSGYSVPMSSVDSGSSLGGRKLTLKEEEVDKLQTEMESQRGIKVTVPIQDALGGIALVEAGGRVWIGGWTQKSHKRVSVGFHIGDQVLSVNGHTVVSLKQVEIVIKSSMSQQSSVVYIVRRLPLAQVYILKRNENFDYLGIVRKDSKAEILDIKHGSLAFQAGLVKEGPSFHNSSVRVPWVITEVNNRPLSIKAKGEEVDARLNAVGKDISILVQPKDFVADLKIQLKSKRNWKDYIVG